VFILVLVLVLALLDFPVSLGGSQEDGKLRILHKTKDEAIRKFDVSLKGLYHFSNVLLIVRTDHQMSVWSISDKRERARLAGHEKYVAFCTRCCHRA
jgi:tRNA (Thr-GGU) A37 N-methylase